MMLSSASLREKHDRATVLCRGAPVPEETAEMQGLNWNDLRCVLAVARGGTLAAAARQLGVDETTVARRLAATEAALAARLFGRVATGRLKATPAGELAIGRAQRVEREVGELAAAIGGDDRTVAGSVSVTAVPILVHHVLVPALPQLRARYPALCLELTAEPRNVSLSTGEADIALRLARPSREAGAAVLARRVGTLQFAVYVPRACPPGAEDRLPWVGYTPAMAQLPQAGWLAAIAARRGDLTPPITVGDAETVLHALRAGLGRSLLPCAVADRLPELRRHTLPGHPPLPAREIWLLTHPQRRRLARVAAVVAWLRTTIGALGR